MVACTVEKGPPGELVAKDRGDLQRLVSVFRLRSAFLNVRMKR